MAKYEIGFSQTPKRILTAGAKLKDEVRNFFSKTTEIIVEINVETIEFFRAVANCGPLKTIFTSVLNK